MSAAPASSGAAPASTTAPALWDHGAVQCLLGEVYQESLHRRPTEKLAVALNKVSAALGKKKRVGVGFLCVSMPMG
jgi:hypothetical protein